MIVTLANGGSATDPDVVAALVGQRTRDRTSPRGRLTPTQLDVLALVADGMSNASIASRLFCRQVRAAQLFTTEHAWGTTAPPLATGV